MVIEMSKRKEKISAFLDNDMHRDELMSFSLSAEADDAKVAQRYQLVGDALRGELSDSSFIDVSQAVREALANENIAAEMSAEHLTSQHSSQGSAKSADNNKMTSGKTTPGFFDWSTLFRPAAGMAMAVFVAVVMVFSLSEQSDDGSVPLALQDTSNTGIDHATAIAEQSQNGQSQTQFRTVANGQNDQSEQANTLLNTAGMNNAGMLNSGVINKRAAEMSPYINQHLEFARQDTLQGRMPYVRAVSFESKSK